MLPASPESISSTHPTHGSGKNQFSGNIPDQTQFSVDDSGQDSTGSDYEWASSPDGVLLVDREEHATWNELHPTELRRLSPHQVNGVDL
ncbi:hypothetical protein AMTR_s03692p00000710 [Amborella trichopoda]|uniref:Uncharacterized protein n=1 Tax=Amborella trichopoda TaxID=13333 RepID=U5CXC0_AMBTC|nr:hypothetical protein AMTR_s03692p00000710 [Amborella trichopoda]